MLFLAVSFSDGGDSLCVGDALAGPGHDCGARRGGAVAGGPSGEVQ